MIIQSGSKAGRTTEEITLKEPDWVEFFLDKSHEGKVSDALKSHIARFNAKPFVEKCSVCKSLATRMTFYIGNALEPYAWCDECDPHSLGATDGKLVAVTSYAQALRFVRMQCKGTRSEKRGAIRALATAKGLPTRVGQPAAIAFFDT